MEQLTIMCSSDLDETVIHTLNQQLGEAYLHVPGAFAVKPHEMVTVEKALTFPASLFIVTASPESVRRLTSLLEGFANQCTTRPCLRMTVHQLSAVV